MPAAAQSAVNSVINIPAIMFLQPGKPNTVPISVAPAGESSNFIRLSGLPPTAELSKGYVIGPSVWSVPVTELQGLTMTLVGEALGRWTVALHLVNAGNATLAEAKTVVVVVPPGSPQVAETGAGIVAASRNAFVAVPQPPAVMSAADRERAMVMLTNGEDQLKTGNIDSEFFFFR